MKRRCQHTATLAALLLAAGCGDTVPIESEHVTGTLENERLTETSGIACLAPDEPAWVANDGGANPSLFAIGRDGSDAGEFPVEGATNVDWEDLAVVRRAGGIELLIADVGDNVGGRPGVTLYRASLDREKNRFTVTERIDVRYPGGPRDVEGVAVDGPSGTVYLLSKRTVPAELYRAGLDGQGSVTAELRGPVLSLPQPGKLARRLAPIHGIWPWQPTSLDISADGGQAAILTYEGIYLYDRRADNDWYETLNGEARFFRLPPNGTAEGICIDDTAVIVAFEGRHSPLMRIRLDDPGWRDLRPGE